MKYEAFLSPKEVTITTQEGVEKTYVISKFDALTGRKMVATYPVANMPKLGEYKDSEAVMLELMTFVAAKTPAGTFVALETRELYTNHVPDWETGGKIEGAMWEHNCSFFDPTKASRFFGDIAQNLQRWIIKTLMGLSEQSSPPAKPPLTN